MYRTFILPACVALSFVVAAHSQTIRTPLASTKATAAKKPPGKAAASKTVRQKAPARPHILGSRSKSAPTIRIQQAQLPIIVPTPLPYPTAAPTPTPLPIPTPTPRPPSTVMFPFALPPFDSSASATNVSFLNDAPAGAKGFVTTRGEHFVDGQGQILRLWGVNLNFSGAFPDKEDAPRIAARLAKFGFNAVRLHHYEGYAAPNGIWKAAAIGSSRVKLPREFDPQQLDRFDFFISELIKRGIYVNLNLHVARKVVEGEGVTAAAQLPEKDKGVLYFDPKLIQLQKEFCRDILTHVNPYTQRALRDEPGVSAVEVANENSLLGMWLEGGLKLPPEYSNDLRGQWNVWLRSRYNEKTLRAAWTEANDPLDPVEILSQPLPPGILNPAAPDAVVATALNALPRYKLATVTGAAGQVQIDPTSGPTADGFVRPGLTAYLNQAGTVSWAFQLNRDGLDLQEGQPYTLSFWARADSPRRISVNLWQDRQPNRFQGFTGYADLTPDWQRFSFVFRPNNPDPQHSRLSWNLGNQTGVVQMGELNLRQGGMISAPAEWTLAGGVPLIDVKTTQVLAVRRDFAEFLSGIEKNYVSQMRAYLKNDLKVRVPIWQTQVQFGGWGGLERESLSDAIDVHAYWKHPDFGASGWSGTSWKVGNVSMVTAAATDPLSGFALFRTPGKPFVISEWNSGQPNDFGAESLLMAAAYAAWQDWAAVYVFDYHSSGTYDRNRFENFFSIDTHAVKMATAPAAALLYRRRNATSTQVSTPATIPVNTQATMPGDLAVAQDTITLTLPRELLWQEVAGFPAGPTAAPAVKTWRDAGAARSASLLGKTYVTFGKGLFPTTTRASLNEPRTLNSDTQQITWQKNPGLFLVDTPRSKAAIGFLGDRTTDLGELRVKMPPSANNWATFTLSSMDGSEISRSRSLVLIAAGKAENFDMGWNADRSSVGNEWGRGPTQVEAIVAEVQVATDLKSARVWALDATGKQRELVPSTLRDGVLTFSTGAAWKTLWYEISG
ncbi:MAG TPA: carbohydrate binding domain-containing protein [Abditibacteriaceae bacterium]|jgi:hypothetical protein